MDFKVITDSCCDLTQELKTKLGIATVPLTMRLGSNDYLDDDMLNLPSFMKKMALCTDKVGSAAPSPLAYQQAYEKAGKSFVVTLSSKLSGSHDSAVTGKQLAEENKKVDVHIFDSKSASAGETLLAMKIHELISENFSKEAIIENINQFIKDMKTYFVLEKYDNLQKNGRLNKITGKIISILGIRLVMGANDGDIALYNKVRGESAMLDKMVALVAKSGKDTQNEHMVISHCNNPTVANRLAEAVQKQFNFKKIYVVPTGGLSSLYADDKGVVMAF